MHGPAHGTTLGSLGLLAVVLGGLAIVVAILVVWQAPARRLARRMRATARSSIAELGAGVLGRIVGRIAGPVMNAELLAAPVSGRPCLAYVFTLTEYLGRSSRTLVRERRGVAFVVGDETGRAVIEELTGRVEVRLHALQAGAIRGDDARKAELLARYRVPQVRGELRYEEAVLTVGDEVAVLGVAAREPDPEAAPDYRTQATRARFQAPLVIDADPAAMR